MSIIIPIITEYMDGGVNKAQKSLKSLVSSQNVAAASLAALVAFSKSAVTAYNQDAKAQQLLALTLRNTTNATDAQIKSQEDYLSNLSRQVAVSDDELRPALGNLLRVTKDQDTAQRLLNESLNIAAATSRPLEQVSLAVGKAYQGNVGALRKMGLSISDSTVKSRDFGAAMREIGPTIQGAAIEAGNSAEGGFKKLGIAVDEAKESIGGLISEAATPWVRASAELISTTSSSSEAQGKLKTAIGLVLPDVVNSTKFWGFLTNKLRGTQEQADATAAAYKGLVSLSSQYASQIQLEAAAKLEAQQKVAAETAAKLKLKLTDLAKTAKGNLKNALEAAQQKVKDLKEESANLAGTLRDQVTGFVSLADAVDTSKTAEDAYNDALKDRAAAYTRLNALEAERQRRGFGPNEQVTYDANEYAQALLDVASAENAVTNAQSNRVNYSEKFASDIAAASQFAGKLKVLAERGLGQPGIQQLLNLGPVAGNQVASDLINGTGPMTVATLRDQLSGLATAGQGLGDVTAGGVFGTAISGAEADVRNLKNAKVVTQNNNVTIQVTSADPQAVVDALKKWMKSNGSIPIKVKG